MALNVTTAIIGGGCQRAVASPSLAQWDRGQILKITGVDLPVTYNVEFCCQGDLTTTTMLGGADSGVEIPNLLLQRGLPIIAYLVLHEGQDDRETEYWITIYVKQRAMPPSVTPDPEQADIIDQLVAALNEGVTAAENAAAQAEAQVEHYPTVIDGTWHVWNALTESWVDTEVPATGPAGRGITSVTQNADYTLTLTFTDGTDWTTPTPVRGATGATPNLTIGTVTTSAAGSSAAASISGTAENPVLSLTIPQGLKGDPGNGDAIAPTFSASTAYPAGAYVIYNGSLYRFTAAHAAGAWVGTDAVAAVLGNDVTILNQQIESKAPVIIDTASGAIASFSDGADGMPIKALTVSIEPQQDLHGYDNPWPGGGGNNHVSDETVSASTLGCSSVFANGTMTITGTATANGGRTVLKTGFFHLDAGTYYFKKFNASGSPAPDAYIQVGNTSITSNTGQFSLGEAKDNVNIGFNVSNGNTYNYSVKLLISKTDDTEWTPPSNICPISGWTGLNLTKAGKNILSWFGYTKVGWYCALPNIFAKLPLGTNLTFSIDKLDSDSHGFAMQLVDANESTIGTLSGYNFGNTEFTRTWAIDNTFKTAKYFRLAGNWNGLTKELCDAAHFQIEIGTTRTSYEAPASEIPISWQTEAGTVYGGEIDLTTGVLTVDRAIVVITDENAIYQESTGYPYAKVNISSAPGDYRKRLLTISNKYHEMSTGTNKDKAIRLTGNASNPQSESVFAYDSDFTSETVMKQILADSPVQVCYYLYTPLVYQLDPVTVSTLLGDNNIFADTGDTTVEYPADTKLYIEKLTAPTEDDMIANANIDANKFFMVGNVLYFSTAAIAQGATIVPGTNCNKVSLADALNTLNV